MGGKKGKKSKKTKKKKTYTKAQQMAKKRIAAKKESAKTSTTSKKTKLTGQQKLASLGRAPKSALGPSKAQQIAKKNIAKYGGTASAAAANKAANKAAIGKAYQAKQTAKKLTGTAAQVAKDNAMYGNTFPSGAIGISEEGKKQAAANRAEVAAKRTAAKGAFNISEEGKKQAEANRAEVAAKRRAEEQAAAQRAAAAEAARKAEAARVKAAEEKRVRMFSTERLSPQDQTSSAFLASFTNPAIQNFGTEAGTWYNKGRLPNEGRMSIRDLMRNDLSQQQQIGKFNPNRKLNLASYARGESNPFRGMPGYGTITGQGQVPGGFQTGPTPSVRQAIERPLKAIGSGLSLLKNPKLAIAGALMTPTSLADGTLTGKPTRFDTEAGGLNIGGSSAKTSEQGLGNNSRTSRVINDIGDAINTYKGIFNDASAIRNAVAPKPQFATFREDAAEQAALNKASTPLSIDSKDVRSDIKSLFGTGMNYKDVANTVSDARAVVEGGAEGFKKLSPSDQQNLVKSAGGIIDNSKVFESLGKQYTGSDTFKDQTQGTLAAVNKTLKEASQDTKGRVDPINKLLKNFNKTPGYETASRFLKQQENPNLTFRQKIQAAYDPKSPKAKALSAKDRGIVGSAGNLLIGGKLSDVFKANNPTERGTTFTPTDSANLIANTMIAAKTPGSLTQKRFSEIGALTGQGTKVTPGTLIRGVNPFRGSNRGGGTTTAPRFQSVGGGGGTTTTTATPTATATPVPQFQVPEFPIQQGTDAGNLANIQNESYQNTFRNLMAINPNYSARFQMRRRRGGRRGSFKRSFSRRFFS